MPAGPADRFSFFREVPVVTVVSSTELRPSATVVIILAEKESNSSVHPSSSVAKAFASSKTCSFVTFITGVCWLVIQSSSTRFSPSPMRPFFEKTSAFFMKSATVAKRSSRKKGYENAQNRVGANRHGTRYLQGASDFSIK